MMTSKKIKNTNDRKKIIFVTHEACLYGATRSMFLLLRQMDLKKYQIRVMSPEEGPLVDKISNLEIPIDIISFRVRKNIQNKFFYVLYGLFCCLKIAMHLLRVVCYFRKEKPDLVYVNTVSRLVPVMAARILRIKVIVHVRESRRYLAPKQVAKKINLFLLLKLDCYYICVSEAIKKLLLNAGVSPKKIAVIYNGIDAEEFSLKPAQREKFRQSLGVSDELLIGFAGRLTKEKGIEDFLKIAECVNRAIPQTRFVIFGDPPDQKYYRKVIMRICEEKKLLEIVQFAGFVKDTAAWFSALDLFVNTSYFDSFPRVNLEAMSLEVPVIASNIDGNPEAVEDTVTGYVVEAGNIREFADRIIDLAGDTKSRIQMGKNARRRVLSRFLSSRCFDEVIKVIEDIHTGTA